LNSSSPGYARDILLFSEMSEELSVFELVFLIAEEEAPVVVDGLAIF